MCKDFFLPGRPSFLLMPESEPWDGWSDLPPEAEIEGRGELNTLNTCPI